MVDVSDSGQVTEAIEAAAGAPYRPLFTIDDVYPDRPDKA